MMIIEGDKIISMSVELDGDMETPVGLYKKLCKNKKGFLLESVEEGARWGRYSFIGRNHIMEIVAYGDRTEIIKDGEAIERRGNAIDVVQEILEEYKTNGYEEEGLTSGAVGFIGYDLIKNIHGVKDSNQDNIQTPDLHLFVPSEIIRYDHLKQKIKITVNMEKNGDYLEKGKKALENIRKDIVEVSINNREKSIFKGSKVYDSNETKDSFMKKVEEAKNYIEKGEVSQVVLSQRFAFDTKMDPFEAYRKLRKTNPSPYMYYMDFGAYQIVGSSPEMLIKSTGKTLETCPIAGTRPRGKTPEEDARYGKELLGDKKEREEHIMLVELSKEDLGKLCKAGTVEVDKYMEIQRYSHVIHIVSHVMGEKVEGLKLYDLIDTCMPAGTVSGSPKKRSMEIIEELEGHKRGIYAGAVGYVGFDGNMDFCITIRTIVFKEEKAYIQAGAGIVSDSKPESEYEETIRKAKALMECIEEGV